MHVLHSLISLLLTVFVTVLPLQKQTVEGTLTDGVEPISGYLSVNGADSGDEVASITIGGDGKYSVELDPGKDYLFNFVSDRHEARLVIVTLKADGTVASLDEDGNVADYKNIALAPAKAMMEDNAGYFHESAKPETRTFSRSYSFSGSLIRALPLSGIRNIDNLGLLVPGVAPAPATEARSGPSFGPTLGTAGQYAVNGLRSRENNFTADGSDNNDEEVGVRRQGFVSPFPQSPESVEEFQIVTALPEAQFGHNIGAQVNVLSRYGESKFHGTLFGFATGTPLNARDFFNQDRNSYPIQFRDLIPITANGRLDGAPVLFTLGPSGSPAIRIKEGNSGAGYQENPLQGKDPYTRVQTGFALGGPISNKSHTYMFASWERQIVHASKQTNFAVPTVQQRGYFDGQGGQVLPAARFGATTPDGDAVFSLFPFPNNPLGPYGPNTFTQVLPADGLADVFLGKIDQQFRIGSTSHILTARHNVNDEDSTLPATGGALFSSVKPRLRSHNFAVFFTSSFGKSLANTFRTSYGRTTAHFDEVRNPFLLPSTRFSTIPFLLNAPLLMNATAAPGNAFQYVAPDSSAGSQYIAAWRARQPFGGQVVNSESLTGPLGEVFVSGFSKVGVDAFHLPQSRAHNTMQFADTVSFTLPRQELSAGFDVRLRHLNSSIEKNVRPFFAFSSLPVPEGVRSNLPVDLLKSTTLVADGTTAGIFQTITFDPSHVTEFRRREFDLFVQDKLLISSRLQLNAGVRTIFNALPEAINDRFKLAFDVQKLKEQAAQDRTSAQGCPLFTAIGQPERTARCQDALDALAESFPSDFRQTFGAEKFRVDTRIGLVWNPSWSDNTVFRGGFGTYTGAFPTIIANESRDPFPVFLAIQHPGNFNGARYGFGRLNDFVPIFLKTGTLNIIDFPFAGISGPDQAVRLTGLLEGSDDAFVALTQPASQLKSPFSKQLSVGIEHQFSARSGLSLAYLGTQGRRLLRITTPRKGLYRSQVRYLPEREQLVILPAQSVAPFQITAFPKPVGAVETRFEGSAESSYDSLQTEYRQRFGNLQIRSAFTYSHAIDEVSDFFDVGGAFALPQDSIRPSERGSANFDARLRLVNYFVWDVPSARGRWAGGWQIAGIHTMQTGQPFTVNSSIDMNIDGNFTDRLNTTAGIADVDQGPVKLSFSGNPLSLLAPVGQDGAVGRNTFRAKGANNFDLALTKRFSSTEGRELQLRVESFNVFNRTHFGMPVRILEFPSFGQSVDTSISPRSLQLSAKFLF